MSQRVVAMQAPGGAPLAPQRPRETLRKRLVRLNRMAVLAKSEPKQALFKLRFRILASHGADSSAPVGTVQHHFLPA